MKPENAPQPRSVNPTGSYPRGLKPENPDNYHKGLDQPENYRTA